jgi:hypothetical protein
MTPEWIAADWGHQRPILGDRADGTVLEDEHVR